MNKCLSFLVLFVTLICSSYCGRAAEADLAGRAAMLVSTAADTQNPSVSVGSVVWSLAPSIPGQARSFGVKAAIDIPDLRMHASMVLRKNVDPGLPASHTIDFRVTFDPESPIKSVKDVALPLMRRNVPPAADALLGVRVKINDGYYLVGLNRAGGDVARNVAEIGSSDWFDFPMELSDGRIAKLTFEKGVRGDSIVADALAEWKTEKAIATRGYPITGRTTQPDPVAKTIMDQTQSTKTDSDIASSIPLKRNGGTFSISVSVNDALTLDFVVDSGAADVSLPADVVMTLMRTGTLGKDDFLGEKNYRLADGSTVPSETFRIHKLRVGDREAYDVVGSVSKVEGSLLLGQSFFQKFKSWSIDNEGATLLLR